MDSVKSFIIPLAQAAATDEKLIGGKTAKTTKLNQADFRTPAGFCITIVAYQQFIRANRLDEKIAFELGRKSFESMRWEVIQGVAPRIRLAFQLKIVS